MRLFTAIALSRPVLANLTRLIGELRPLARLRWSPADNLHLTVKFIGEWPETRLNELKTVLDALPAREPVTVSVEGIAWFPNPHSPRVLAVAAHAEGLASLVKDTDRALAPLGVPAEEREFRPHLTLARIKEPRGLSPLRQAIAKLPSVEFGSFPADRFYLYSSKPTESGSIYSELADFPFQK